MYFRNAVRNNSDFKYGKGWPAYRDVSAAETEKETEEKPQETNNENKDSVKPSKNTKPMYNTAPNTIPMYDTMPGKSIYNNTDGMNTADRQLLAKLYTNINKILYPYVVEVVSQFDYEGSPIYNEKGMDKETMAQLVIRVLDLAQKDNDEVEEIRTENVPYPTEWDRNMLLKNLIEAVLLSYVFNDRRPRYRTLVGNYGLMGL